MYRRICFCLILACVGAVHDALSQRKIEITFDSLGVQTGVFPAYVFKGDQLIFKVLGRKKTGDVKKKMSEFSKLSSAEFQKKINDNNQYFSYDATNGDIKKFQEQVLSILKNHVEYRVRIMLASGESMIQTLDSTVADGNWYISKKKEWITVRKSASGDELKFQLIRTSESSLLLQLLALTKGSYKDPTVYFERLKTEKFVEEIEQKAKEIDALRKFDFLKPEEDKIKKLEDAVKKKVLDNEKIIEKILSDNKNWLIAWSWLNDYKLSLNPLQIEGPDKKEIDRVGQDIEELKKSIELYNKEIEFYKECCCRPDPKSSKVMVCEPVEALHKIILEQSRKLISQQLRHDELVKKSADYDKALQALSQVRFVSYDGFLFLSTVSRIHWMRHHNAARDYEWTDKSEHPTMYPEIDEVHILAENVKESVSISLEETLTAYSPQSTFTEYVLPALDAIDGALKAVPSGAKDLSDLGKLEVNDVEKNRYTTEVALATWIKANAAPVPEDVLKLKASSQAPVTLKTELAGPSKPKEAPTLVKYTLFSGTKDSRTDLIKDMQYKVYKLYKVQPFVSIVYLPNDRVSPVYDQAKQTFSDVSLGKYDFVAGFKFFPAKTNIELRSRDRRPYRKIPHNASQFKLLGRHNSGQAKAMLLRGNQWLLNNLSLSVGVGTQQEALKNWFLGGGLDIIKGFAINTGVNLYSRNSYDIQNGVVRSSSSSFASSWYVGFSVDPIVATKALGIFKPK